MKDLTRTEERKLFKILRDNKKQFSYECKAHGDVFVGVIKDNVITISRLLCGNDYCDFIDVNDIGYELKDKCGLKRLLDDFIKYHRKINKAICISTIREMVKI